MADFSIIETPGVSSPILGGLIDRSASSNNKYSSMVTDATSDSRASLAKDLGFDIHNSEDLDYLTQAIVGDYASQQAFDRELKADSTKIQRAVADAVKAGINPIQALGGMYGGSPGAAPASISGGLYTQARNNKNSVNAQIFGTLVTALVALFAGGMMLGKGAALPAAKSIGKFVFK